MSELAAYAKKNGIKFFLFNFTDLFGVQRAKLVPAEAAARMQKAGAGFAGFATWLDQTPAHPDILVMPDVNSIIPLPWRPDVAWVAGEPWMNGEPLAQAPRVVLRKLSEHYAKKNMKLMAGVEPEFHLINADGSAVVTGQCAGSAVTRCDGTITLYGDPSVLDARAARISRANERVVIGTAKFAGAAGTAVTAKTALSAAGRKLLQKRGAVRVTPVMTFTGGTRLDNELAGFTLSMMNTEQWLRRAMATLYVGGQPRMDLNILIDQAKRRVVPRKLIANRIENTIIPQRERARERVSALPTPPPSLQPIVTLLLRAFNQSLQANHAYIDWLRSGRAADDRGWRISLRASGTKAQLLNRLAKAGAPYGIRVPSATNFWP